LHRSWTAIPVTARLNDRTNKAERRAEITDRLASDEFRCLQHSRVGFFSTLFLFLSATLVRYQMRAGWFEDATVN